MLLQLKRYKNRKLYCIKTHKYIVFDQIIKRVKAGDEILIICDQTHKDITTQVLTRLAFNKARNVFEGNKEALLNLIKAIPEEQNATFNETA